MLAEGHSRLISRPRHVAMYLAKQLTTRSFADIGRTCGGRDHTTVVHAVKGIEARLRGDAELAHHVACIRDELEEMYSGKGEDRL
jgi:chromosomal replication initiator protein